MNNKQIELIKNALRQVARYMPAKAIALELARNWLDHGVRGGAKYRCAECAKSFGSKEVQVDHIQPVVPLDREIKDWNEYMSRLFCSSDNLQVLCKPCHKDKCNEETKIRTQFKHSLIKPDN